MWVSVMAMIPETAPHPDIAAFAPPFIMNDVIVVERSIELRIFTPEI